MIPGISKMADDELRYWLAKFVVEIRKKGGKGEFYPATSLYQLCCGLLRFLRNNGRETNGAQFNNCTFYVGNDFTV